MGSRRRSSERASRCIFFTCVALDGDSGCIIELHQTGVAARGLSQMGFVYGSIAISPSFSSGYRVQ